MITHMKQTHCSFTIRFTRAITVTHLLVSTTYEDEHNNPNESWLWYSDRMSATTPIKINIRFDVAYNSANADYERGLVVVLSYG